MKKTKDDCVRTSNAQVEPWRPDETLRIRFFIPHNTIIGTIIGEQPTKDLLRMVATADDRSVEFHEDELWCVGNLSQLTSLTAGAELNLYIESAKHTDDPIGIFLDGYPPCRPVSEICRQWSNETYKTTATEYFFSMPDADERAQGSCGSPVVGVSFVIDGAGKLLGVSWHKTFNPSTEDPKAYAWKPPAVGLIKRGMQFIGRADSCKSAGRVTSLLKDAPWWVRQDLT
ncbi:uncharacterized protein SOCE26_031510 [Sorangium cellulosum]|uniref:Uncharacterized protein n=1 Tax=Sorangium cellulosum TaxID=56 RepID=A0A2L0EQY2_SORCE|nr:hypothetical protein [Sorangium cellulosum]AUX41728.1 uncharacterized protein SOCE26_031510 [Sorangium cellulosum]